METDITISVVIPLHHSQETILRTIESVRAQTFPAFEIIIIDDGSRDSGFDLIKDMMDIYSVEAKCRTIAEARNIGIKEAVGEYIAFLQPGDEWDHYFLEEIACMIDQCNSAGIYATAYRYLTPGIGYVDANICVMDSIEDSLMMDNYFEIAAAGDLPFVMSSVVLKHSDLQRLGGFLNDDLMEGGAQDLFARIALEGTIAYSKKILAARHRQDVEPKAQDIPKFECKFSKRLFALTKTQWVHRETRGAILDYTAEHLLRLAKLNMQIGRLLEARRLLDEDRCARRPLKKIFYELMYFVYAMRFTLRGEYSINV